MTASIPFLLMRGGTSRGPFFRREDLPPDLNELSNTLIRVIGAGHPLCIDGVGGSASVQCKVAVLSASSEPDVDVDYLFAQVGTVERKVDYGPTCGNMLAAVGPAAVELGLVAPKNRMVVRAVNTGARIATEFQMEHGIPVYAGDAQIDGVPGKGAPVRLMFCDTVGSKTGALFPTGHRTDSIDGLRCTCIDVAVPVLILRAADVGLSGKEGPSELDARVDVMRRVEAVRVEAGARMGLGDVTESVLPKVALLSEPEVEGAIARVQYLTPTQCHPTLAVTGAQAVASSLVIPGTIAPPHRFVTGKQSVNLQHPGGSMTVLVEVEGDAAAPLVRSVGVMRTARKIASGYVFT
ncbi:PrpF domain-containing protein [Boseongicola sp. H5]|uniref:PrpF domain-containing protein n=1 Tax=Boseongicola sp. H5 TaxID=2763261 RepID=UPI001D0A20B9|nr:PrpF domain-containing protein [Boseongicola sp. H5]